MRKVELLGSAGSGARPKLLKIDTLFLVIALVKSIGDEFKNIVSWYHGVEVKVEIHGGQEDDINSPRRKLESEVQNVVSCYRIGRKCG